MGIDYDWVVVFLEKSENPQFMNLMESPKLVYKRGSAVVQWLEPKVGMWAELICR